MDKNPDRLFESDVVRLLAELSGMRSDVRNVRVEPLIGDRLRPDLVVERHDGSIQIIEVKMRGPQTANRLGSAAFQLVAYRQLWQQEIGGRVALALALPNDVLTFSAREELRQADVEVWDREDLLARVAHVSDSELSDEAAEAKRVLIGSASVDDVSMSPAGVEVRHKFNFELDKMPCGQKDWSRYQRLCAEILTHLFCPPLELPLHEVKNASGVNRRDIVLPNYAVDGFWRFLRQGYQAEYIVVDAKNLCSSVKKTHVLQLANYLTSAGTGLFGLILTRRSESTGAQITRREQWLLHRKMILVITDDDVHQMIKNKDSGSAPEELLRQKLQDFRLEI